LHYPGKTEFGSQPLAAQVLDALHSYADCSPIELRVNNANGSYQEVSRAAGYAAPLEVVRRVATCQRRPAMTSARRPRSPGPWLLRPSTSQMPMPCSTRRESFTDQELIDLTLTIATANFDRSLTLVVPK
jgi:alkylhydroperoxidase family enzyme